MRTAANSTHWSESSRRWCSRRRAPPKPRPEHDLLLFENTNEEQMSRIIVAGAAQLGPIELDTPRNAVVQRMMELMREAHSKGCDVVVYPEMALTTFFPRWWFENQEEVDVFFERSMP